MTDVVIELGIGVLGAILLHVAYSGFAFQWPGQYTSLSNTYSLGLNRSLPKLVAFRFVPIFLVGLIMFSVSNPLTGQGWLAIASAASINAVSTNVVAIVRTFKPGLTDSSVNYGAYHMLALLVVACAAVSASFSGPYLSFLVPSSAELVNALWTAALAGLFGAFILNAIDKGHQVRQQDAEYFYDRACHDVGVDIFDTLFRRCSDQSVDPVLAKAIAIAEVMQRPKWFRQMENLLGKMSGRSGTYGFLQMQAPKPLSDVESIEKYVDTNAGFVPLKIEDYGIDANENFVWKVAGKHNGDKPFITQVLAIYRDLLYGFAAVPGTKTVLVEKRRYAEEWGLRFISLDEQISIGEKSTQTVYKSHGQDVFAFEHRLPIDHEEVRFVTYGAKKNHVSTLRLSVTDGPS